MQRFYLPTEIITGCGSLSQLGRIAARYGRRVMVVTYAGFAQFSDTLSRALQALRHENLEVILYDNVVGEADLRTVEEGIALARKQECQVFIGIGGGSSIDTAKAIAGLVTLPGSAWDYHAGRALEGPGLPFIAVPTTAGTGAEVTKNAVLIDPRTEVKKSIRDDAWFARVALVDPELTLSMPPQVTASTGADALCQAIESFTSIAATPITDALAMQAIALTGRNLLRAYKAGDDLAAREAMSMGSLMAGMAMVNARLGGVHGMAHPLGSHFHIPHGVICGLLLPYTMEYNLPYAMAKYAQVARLLGEPVEGLEVEAAAHRAVEHVRELMAQVGIPAHLSQFGVTEERFEQIAKESQSESLKHNPRPLGIEDVCNIMRAAL
jgi:alcohol dehydrogenase class IV